MPDPMILLHWGDRVILTPQEYDAVLQDVLMRHAMGATQPGDRILASLLEANSSRRFEIAQLGGPCDPDATPQDPRSTPSST